MTLRWGFKSEANWYSSDLRRGLGLLPHAPVDLFSLAGHLDIPLFKLSQFRADYPLEVARLSGRDITSDFSAATLFVGNRRHIVYNDAHGPKRTASDLAHEISHCVLLHPPSAMFGEDYARTYSVEQEEEANWLGPAILISEEAALNIVQRRLTTSQASNAYGATEDVIRMRLNVTGAFRRIDLKDAAE